MDIDEFKEKYPMDYIEGSLCGLTDKQMVEAAEWRDSLADTLDGIVKFSIEFSKILNEVEKNAKR
jgi:hypothetical protein